MPDPKAEAPVLGLRILTPLGEFCDVIIFQFVGWYGFGCIVNALLLLSHGFFFEI